MRCQVCGRHLQRKKRAVMRWVNGQGAVLLELLCFTCRGWAAHRQGLRRPLMLFPARSLPRLVVLFGVSL